MKKVNNNSMPSNFGATMSFNLKKKTQEEEKIQDLKNLKNLIQDELPNLGLLEQLNFKIVNELKFLQQLNLQQPNSTIIRNIKIEYDGEIISSMLNDLKELKQKLEQFPTFLKEMNLISQLIELENLTNFINGERSRFQGIGMAEAAINIILKPYIDSQNNLKSSTEKVLTELNLPLSSTSNNVLDTLPTEIQKLVKKINSYRGFIFND
jgi:hypothetical protein